VAAAAPWTASPRFLLAAALAIGVIGAGVGYGLAKSGIPHFVRDRVVAPVTAAVRGWLNMPVEALWEHYDTQLGPFETVRVSVASPDGGPMAALEELDGHLIFMAQSGAFSTLSPDLVLRDLDIAAPMNTEALRAANIKDLNFDHFRALDLLAVEAGPQAFDLYASYNRFNAADTCFQVVVSRMRITTSANAVAPQSGWEDIYATTPCVPPRTAVSQFASAFVGIQSGGRLALPNPTTLLLSVGDLEFDGVMYQGLTEAPNGPQNPAWDLGKVLSIDLASGRAQHLAMGFRNPQGLLIGADGRIWETEHGPYGGDEVNLIRGGGNYGWPNVTYGMQYVPIRENWPLNTTRGGHEGYERPAYVFVPAIGISQLIQPSAEAFPFWNSSLLVTSLRGRALYALRLDGDRIMYAEPLPMGERLRDIINRANGQIAILTDAGNLALMRAVQEGEAQTAFAITDARRRTAPAAPTDAGRQLFAGNCQSCHSLAGASGAGPSLAGVVGRDIAAADFNYSPALRGARGDWTEARLIDFLDHPERFPGAAMPDAGLTREQAEQIVAYLKTTED
jgi:cytochrome c2